MDDHFVNLGEEVILTLLWQSGASESATVLVLVSVFAIDCSNVKFARRVCVCERERERREGQRSIVCVCSRVCACVCVCVLTCVRHGHTTTACLQTHMSIITVSVTRICSPLGLELMVKLRTLSLHLFIYLFVFTTVKFKFILKAKACNYGKGRYISDDCMWCSANHNALGQLANQSRLLLSEWGTL